MKPKSVYCSNCGVLAGVGFASSEEARSIVECVADLKGVLDEVMPQVGSIVLQDYERLNRAMFNAGLILSKHA